MIHRFNLSFVRISLCLLLLCYHIWMDSFLVLIYKGWFIYNCIYACLYVCVEVSALECRCPLRPVEGVISAVAGVTDGYEPSVRMLETKLRPYARKASMVTTSLFSRSLSIYFWLAFLSVLKPLWRTFKWQILWYLIIHFNKLDNWYFHLHFPYCQFFFQNILLTIFLLLV